MEVADLNSLAIFAKVVEAKGFSEAARRLKIPISTVSRRVAELEDQLSVRLLERCKRNIEMTPLCNIEVTLPRVLGSREVRRGGGVDEQAGVQPS